MEIRFKDKDTEILFKDLDSTVISNNGELINIIKLLKGIDEGTDIQLTPISEKIVPIKEKINNIKEERPVIRKRLPNQIDLSELDIKKAMTEEPMIRCPLCGQSSKVIICIEETQNYLLRKVYKDNKPTFETVLLLESEKDIDNICRPNNADQIKYHNDIMNIKVQKKLKDTNINADKNTICKCPVCSGTASFNEWIEAYKHPLDAGFETELLCEVCGGESVETIDKDKNKVIKCESCGHITPSQK